MYVRAVSTRAEAYLLLTGRLSISRSRGAGPEADFSPSLLTAKVLNRLEIRLKQLGRGHFRISRSRIRQRIG